MAAQSFKTTILAGKEKNVTGIEVPAEVVAALGAGERPRLRVTVNNYSFVSSIGKMGGKFMISFSAAHRAASGLTGGDAVQVELAVAPKAPATVLPADFSAVLADTKLTEAFESAAPSRRKEWVRSIQDAKAPETRAKRIQKVVDALASARTDLP
jgi:hypothetical protein